MAGPMEKCNEDALMSLTGDLKVNVKMNMGLLDKLPKAAGGFMDRAETQAVTSKAGDAEQMGALIDILLGKSNADFKIFCTMLRKSNNGVWADQLERKAKELAGQASPFSVSGFLKTYEDEFIAVVNAKQSLLKLKHKGVISPDVRTALEAANEEDAKYILFEHLEKNATVDTLREYCDVAIAAEGFPKMKALGRKMKGALP